MTPDPAQLDAVACKAAKFADLAYFRNLPARDRLAMARRVSRLVKTSVAAYLKRHPQPFPQPSRN